MRRTYIPDCVFCSNLISLHSSDIWDRRLAETRDYIVTPTKGALLPGWLLVTSRRHVLCAGALDVEELSDLRRAIDRARTLVEKGFGQATLFEHGPAARGTG
jgi:diadenosine tetraphosphate (Ap4A) HIT family hydrolase